MHGEGTGAEQGEAVLEEAVTASRDTLGARLLAAYALGSLAHGGFTPLVSDVDLGLVLADPPTPKDEETIQSVADTIKARGSVLRERLSVFWGTPSTLQGRLPGGRFPALDRLDLLENGRLLAGQDARKGLVRPSHTQLLVEGAEFALDYLAGGRGSVAPPSPGLGSMRPADNTVLEEIRTPTLLVSRGPRQVTKLVLFPVRFLFTAATGQVGTTALAVEHYLADAQAPAAELVAAALQWRIAPSEDNDAAASLLGRELIPLYVRFIDDHTIRLTAVGRADLARSFEQWRARLLA
jgi:predicted nucleotidyltransferase